MASPFVASISRTIQACLGKTKLIRAILHFTGRLLGSSDVFGEIEREDFLVRPFLERLKSALKILPQLWTLPFSLLAAWIMGIRRLEPAEIVRALGESNKKLLEEKERMTSEKARRLCDLVIDLNNLGIDGSDEVNKEVELLKK